MEVPTRSSEVLEYFVVVKDGLADGKLSPVTHSARTSTCDAQKSCCCGFDGLLSEVVV